MLSNHFGLAEAYDVPWTGCQHVTDPASKQWLIEAQIPLLPWSSQARGFFARPANPDDLSDPDLVRRYYSDDNFERLRRAEKLGRDGRAGHRDRAGFRPGQPFPTFPLFGPALGAPSGGARDAPARQQTLRATIDRSHELLSDPEERSFAPLLHARRRRDRRSRRGDH